VAVMSSVAVSQADGAAPLVALTDGFQAAFAAAIAFAVLGVLAAALLLGRVRAPAAVAGGEPAGAAAA
jgi:hypothetical protein